jgi:hypothetical protein
MEAAAAPPISAAPTSLQRARAVAARAQSRRFHTRVLPPAKRQRKDSGAGGENSDCAAASNGEDSGTPQPWNWTEAACVATNCASTRQVSVRHGGD